MVAEGRGSAGKEKRRERKRAQRADGMRSADSWTKMRKEHTIGRRYDVRVQICNERERETQRERENTKDTDKIGRAHV